MTAPTIFGISDADYHSWKHNPVTKIVMRYLADFAGALERDHTQRWKAGQSDDRTEYEAVGRVKTLEELANLQFEHIVLFYQETEEKEADEATFVRDATGEV